MTLRRNLEIACDDKHLSRKMLLSKVTPAARNCFSKTLRHTRSCSTAVLPYYKNIQAVLLTIGSWASQHMARIPLLALMFVATIAVAGAAVPAACLEFDKYPITEIFRGPYVKPNLSTPAQVHRFRTVIREGSEGAPDFAGRFRVVHWGCGSNCHAFALVDRKTGEVYPVPETAALGAGFRLNSGLFVIDTPEMIKESGSPLFATMTFAWNEQSRSLVALPGCNGYAQPGGQPDAAR